MGEIVKFPGDTNRLGFRRVRKHRSQPGDPNQLDLFVAPAVRISSVTPTLSLFEQALVCDEQGDRQAAELYEKSIASQEFVADAYCNLGIIESKNGNTAKAFDCFTTSLKHDPRHVESHYNLGNLYFEVNDFRLAQVHFELAAEIDPTFANVFFNLALALSLNNDLAAGITALTKYQKLVPPEEAAHAEDLLRILRQSLAAKVQG